MNSKRERWVSVATLCEGFAAPTAAFRDWVAPERLEGRGLSDEMMRMWCCFLTWLALARAMGIGSSTGDPEADHAYVIGHAGSDAVAVAMRHSAWNATWAGVSETAPRPTLGDMVVIGAGGYHCRACIVADDGAGNLEIIEGGHITGNGDPRGPGHMCIDRVKVRLWWDGGKLHCGSGASTDGNRVYGWADCTKFPDGDVVAERVVENGADGGRDTDPAPAT